MIRVDINVHDVHVHVDGTVDAHERSIVIMLIELVVE